MSGETKEVQDFANRIAQPEAKQLFLEIINQVRDEALASHFNNPHANVLSSAPVLDVTAELNALKKFFPMPYVRRYTARPTSLARRNPLRGSRRVRGRGPVRYARRFGYRRYYRRRWY